MRRLSMAMAINRSGVSLAQAISVSGKASVPLIGGAIGWALPPVVIFIVMFRYQRPVNKRFGQPSKELGIDRAAIKRARLSGSSGCRSAWKNPTRRIHCWRSTW